MKETSDLQPAPPPASFKSVLLLTICCFALGSFYETAWLLRPLDLFVTALHEMGHALACIATGGTVTGLTIVSDGHGHAGLTYCRGGIPFIYGQAGYLGASFFGCLMIWCGRYPDRAKSMLIGLGVMLAIGSLFFMSRSAIGPAAVQVIASMGIGLLMSGALLIAGYGLKPQWAQYVLLFLGIQTAMNALADLRFLTLVSLGARGNGAFSDATNMAASTGIPAVVWALGWGLASLAMVFFTIKWGYFAKAK